MDASKKLYLWVMLYGLLMSIVTVIGFPFMLAGLWLVNLGILLVGYGICNFFILSRILKYVG